MSTNRSTPARLTVRPPAWPGFAPFAASFRPIPPPPELCASLGTPGQLLGRDEYPAAPGGLYHFLPDGGAPPLFLKIVDHGRLTQQLAADRIAAWLQGQGLRTSPLLAGFPRPLPNGRRLLAYRLVDGGPAQTDGADMIRLGRGLARLHRLLRSLPWRDEIRSASLRRDLAFRSARQRLLKRRGLDPALRSILLADSTDLPGGPAQPLHGDLNLGNVLFRSDDRAPVFLDFEDAVHNHHPAGVDLAMAIERFVLVRQTDDDRALADAARLLAGYRELDRPGGWSPLGLGALLRALSVRALVLLHAGDGPVDSQERGKFGHLIRQTHERAALLAAIQRL